MNYFAFDFKHGNATIGKPNRITGYRDLAGQLAVFTNKKDRDDWINKGQHRGKITKKAARGTCLGMTVRDYNDHVKCLTNEFIGE